MVETGSNPADINQLQSHTGIYFRYDPNNYGAPYRLQSDYYRFVTILQVDMTSFNKYDYIYKSNAIRFDGRTNKQ